MELTTNLNWLNCQNMQLWFSVCYLGSFAPLPLSHQGQQEMRSVERENKIIAKWIIWSCKRSLAHVRTHSETLKLWIWHSVSSCDWYVYWFKDLMCDQQSTKFWAKVQHNMDSQLFWSEVMSRDVGLYLSLSLSDCERVLTCSMSVLRGRKYTTFSEIILANLKISNVWAG